MTDGQIVTEKRGNIFIKAHSLSIADWCDIEHM